VRESLQKALQAALLAPATQAVDAVLPLFVARRWGKADTLLRQGDVWGHAYFIEEGLLRMHFIRRDGKEFNKRFHAEGALVCPLTRAMEEGASLFALTAVERSLVWQAPSGDFRSALGALGAWEPLRGVLLERLVTHKLQREHDLLAYDGRTRYEQLCARDPALAHRVPLAQLATYLGLTDVSLSRIRRQQRNNESG
jgi:CRP-like cAMP-binding protein